MADVREMAAKRQSVEEESLQTVKEAVPKRST